MLPKGFGVKRFSVRRQGFRSAALHFTRWLLAGRPLGCKMLQKLLALEALSKKSWASSRRKSVLILGFVLAHSFWGEQLLEPS